MAKLPAFQFYPGDWLQDGISGCSLAAQGLWLRMMFIAHNSETYGYLGSKLAPMTPSSIAQRCGCTLDQYTILLSELELNGIPSRTPAGTIFSRRMIRDAKCRADNKHRQQDFRNSHKVNGNSNATVTAMSQRSSSSSSTTSSNTKTEPKGSCPPAPKERPENFANAWNATRGSLPKVQEFTESRRKKVQARMRQGITEERFTEAVRLCTTMPFLQGTNRNGWVATFDWLIENDRNISKVLEGNYREVGGLNANKHEGKHERLMRELAMDEAAPGTTGA